MKFIIFLIGGQSITKTILLIHAVIIFTASLSYAQQETNGCNTNCSAEWNNQICATNDEGKTELFPNECVMKSKNCLNKSKYVKTGPAEGGSCP